MEQPELLSEAKFTSYDSKGHEIIHDYGKVYEVDESRLTIAASTNQIVLILKFVDTLKPPFYILYVLVVSRLDNERGRYQSPLIETKEELTDFLLEYKQFFETDGRHHIWICTLDNSGRLIYDQHNVIFAYGQTEKYINLLEKEGFIEQEFSFPVPHAHAYNESNDRFEESLMNYWEWSTFPLADGDEYA